MNININNIYPSGPYVGMQMYAVGRPVPCENIYIQRRVIQWNPSQPTFLPTMLDCSQRSIFTGPSSFRLINGISYVFSKVIKENGTEMEGYWRDGKLHMYGAARRPDGARFEGFWENGIPHGRGRFFSPDGVIYTLNMDKGRPSGKIFVDVVCLKKNNTPASGVVNQREGEASLSNSNAAGIDLLIRAIESLGEE